MWNSRAYIVGVPINLIQIDFNQLVLVKPLYTTQQVLAIADIWWWGNSHSYTSKKDSLKQWFIPAAQGSGNNSTRGHCKHNGATCYTEAKLNKNICIAWSSTQSEHGPPCFKFIK